MRKPNPQRVKLYFIAAKQMYPIGNAGAVVAARNKKEAAECVGELQQPEEPMYIGIAKNGTKPKTVIFSNSTIY